MTVADDLARLLSRLGSGPVFVHSDPFRAASLVPKTKDREAFIDSQLVLLSESAGERALWMPAFNYDFPRTHSFDVKRDPSQLGPITERFRATNAEWRTPIPIFSATGTGPRPEIEWKDSTDPFGDDSLFARLVEADGVILYYGDTFHFNTIVHYAERSCGPPYRYDKVFPGDVIRADGIRSKGNLIYHVRPLGMGLEYDWAGILTRAIAAGACVRSEDHPQILASSASSLTDFLVAEMREDYLALLDAPTRQWVAPALQKLGRRFVIQDFEAGDTRRTQG
ncbi:MAG: AAC(3) family N-acetyltransferase [Gemmatimonadaceae bacterium]